MRYFPSKRSPGEGSSAGLFIGEARLCSVQAKGGSGPSPPEHRDRQRSECRCWRQGTGRYGIFADSVRTRSIISGRAFFWACSRINVGTAVVGSA